MITGLMVRTLLAGVAIAAVLGGTAYGVHKYNDNLREQGREEVRAEYALVLQKQHDAAKIRERDLTTQRDTAVDDANKREITLRTLASAVRGSSNSLRDTVAAIRASVPTASEEALRHATLSLSTVFADCQERYGTLAETADRHASDARTLDEAFPASATPAQTKDK